MFILMLVVIYPLAQTSDSNKQKLENKKKKIEQEIAYNKKLLEETKKKQNLSVNQIVLLQNQIKKREELLDEINREIDSLEIIIKDYEEVLRKQNENLRSLRDEYAKIVYHAWKTRNSHDRLLYIFSSKDMEQAYMRLKYFQQYSDYRRRQAELITETIYNIDNHTRELKKQKSGKTNLLIDNSNEKEKLDKERNEKEQSVKKLKQKEAEIKRNIKAKEDEAKKLKEKIAAIIAEEIRKAAELSNKKADANTELKSVLTPEEKLISDNFSSNKGKLPWPVPNGVISGYYGEHDHPVLQGIKTKNNGIDITTNTGTVARSVYKGTVSSVITITNTNKAIIIRHGDFFTVYSNLSSVFVSKGQTIDVKQNIGTIYTDPDEGKTVIHFEIWEGKTLHNPYMWIAK